MNVKLLVSIVSLAFRVGDALTNTKLTLQSLPQNNDSAFQLAWTYRSGSAFQASVWIQGNVNETRVSVELADIPLRLLLKKSSLERNYTENASSTTWSLFATNRINLTSFETKNVSLLTILLMGNDPNIQNSMFHNGVSTPTKDADPASKCTAPTCLLYKIPNQDGSIFHFQPYNSSYRLHRAMIPPNKTSPITVVAGRVVMQRNVELAWYNRLDNFQNRCFLDIGIWVRHLPPPSLDFQHVSVCGNFTYYKKDTTGNYKKIKSLPIYMNNTYCFEKSVSEQDWDLWRIRGWNASAHGLGIEITGSALVRVSYHISFEKNDTFDYGRVFKNNTYIDNSDMMIPEGSAMRIYDWTEPGGAFVK